MSAVYLFFSSWLRAGITIICHNHRFSQHLCLLHAGITVICHNHRFIRSPNSKVGSFEIAKIKIAKIISHTFIFKSRKFSSAKNSRYTVCDINHFQLSMHCDLDLLPFDRETCRAYPRLIGSICMMFHNERCKGKVIMRHKPFTIINALWPWPFDLRIHRAHPCLMRSLCAKFHDDKCKRKLVMRH